MTNEDLKRFYPNNPNINEPNDFVRLNSRGKVPAENLPSYVDDVIEGYYYNDQFYEDELHTKLITPEENKIYVDLITNNSYRWSGTVYVILGMSEVPVEYGNGKDSVKNKTPYDETDVDSHGNVIDRTNYVYGDFSATFGSRNSIGTKSSETFVTGGKNTVTQTEDALISGYENTTEASHQSVIGGYDNDVKASESIVVGNENQVDGNITGGIQEGFKTDTRYNAIFGANHYIHINTKYTMVSGQDNEVRQNGKWNFLTGAHHDLGRNNECVNLLGWTNITKAYLTDSTLAGYSNTAYGGDSDSSVYSVYMLGHSNDNQDPSNTNKGLSEVYQIGHDLIAKHENQVILGKYNLGSVAEANDVLTIGCGEASDSRADCFGTGISSGDEKYIRVGSTTLTETQLIQLIQMISGQ